MSHGDPTYFERVKDAFNFRENPGEATARTLIPTAAASALLTILNNSGAEVPVPPVYQKDPEPAKEKIVTIPGRQHYVNGKIAKTKEAIPAVDLTFKQAYAPEFQATPLQGSQTGKLDRFAKDVETEYYEGPESIEIKIKGLSSDESGVEPTSDKDANLGKKSEDNKELALQRAKLVEDYLKDRILRIDPEYRFNTEFSFKLTGEEQLLDSKQIETVDDIAKSHDASRKELVDDHNDSKSIKLNKLDARILENYFEKNRGARVTATATYDTTPHVDKCDQVVRVVQEPDQQLKEITPGNDGWGLYFFPLVIPPLPKRRRRQSRFSMPDFELPSFGTKKTPKEPEQLTEQPYVPKLRARDLFAFNIKKPAMPPIPKIKVPTINKPTVPEGLKKAAGVGLVLAILPFPWVTKGQERKEVSTGNECAAKEYKPGKTKRIYGNILPLAAYRAIKGRDDWNKQLDMGEQQYTLSETTTTTEDFMRYEVDKEGKVLDTQFFDKTVNKEKFFDR